MEQPDRSLRGSAPASSDPSPWQQRVEKKDALIRKRQARHLQARLRHRITKTTLVGTLFEPLDTHNVGALGRDELNQFALLTGFQRDREELYEENTILLDTWGSTHARRFSESISLLHFTKIVSRTGTLSMTKAELRRTSRYNKAPEIQGPRVQYGHGSWRSLKHMKIFSDAQQWKQGIVWHRGDPAWLLNQRLCSDPSCPLKTHPEYFGGM